MVGDWIKFEGTEMPVSADTPVDVEFEDYEWDGKASNFDWANGEILAYRVNWSQR